MPRLAALVRDRSAGTGRTPAMKRPRSLATGALLGEREQYPYFEPPGTTFSTTFSTVSLTFWNKSLA